MDIRSLLLFLTVLPVLALSTALPYVGVLSWGWISFLNPHREVWGIGYNLQWNLLIAVITMGSWLVSNEPKRLRLSTPLVILAMLTIWLSLSTYFSPGQASSMETLTSFIKVLALVLMVNFLLYKKSRLIAFIGIIVLSIGYWGIKGGLTLIGGGGVFTGPEKSMIGDRNHLALAVALSIPLMNFFRIHLANRWLSLGFAGAMLLSAMSVVASQSRGGFVALLVAAVGLWFVSQKKARGLIAGVLAFGLIFAFASDKWWDRIETIQSAEQDSSFQGRLDAWKIAINIANDRVFGLGLRNIQNRVLAAPYVPPDSKGARAAHSIYFEVLSDAGWVALFLFLAFYLSAVWEGERAKRIARNYVEMAWIYNLTCMIQISLLVYAVGGAALSMAYWGIPLILAISLAILRRMAVAARREIEAPRPAPAVAGEGAEAKPAARPAKGVSGTGADTKPTPPRRPGRFRPEPA